MQQSEFSLALNAFKNADDKLAFKAVNRLPLQEAVRLLLSLDSLKSKPFRRHLFWDGLVDHCNQLSEVLQTVYAAKLIHFYWRYFPESGSVFFEYLEKNKPVLLIQTIRNNGVFLNEEKWKRLNWKVTGNPFINRHLAFIKKLVLNADQREAKIAQFRSRLSQLGDADFLNLLAGWYYQITLLTTVDLFNPGINDQLFAINDSINFYRSVRSNNDWPATLTEEQLNLDEIVDVDWLVEMMDLFVERHQFTSNVVQTYCYDLAFDITHEEQKYKLICTEPEKYRKWRKNGHKILYFQDSIRREAEEMNGNRYDHGSDEYEQLVLIEQEKTKLLGSYYGIGSTDVDALKDLVLVKTRLWEDALQNAGQLLRIESTETINRFIQHSSISPERSLKVRQRLSTDMTKDEVNLVLKPLLQNRDQFYLLNQSLISTDIATSTINSWLLDLQGTDTAKQEVHEMEKQLADLFLMNDIAAKANIGYQMPDGSKAEFDVVAYHNNHLLLIEMKRTRISDTLLDTQVDFNNNLLTAAMQLYRNEMFIRENPDLFINHFPFLNKENIPFLHIEKWIISNSFEHDHELVDGCLKVSLFELQSVLKELNRLPLLNKLMQIKRMIRSEEFWQERVPDDDGLTPGFPLVYWETENQ